MNNFNDDVDHRPASISREPSKKAPTIWLALAIFVSLVLSLAAQYSLLTNPYSINDDARSSYRHIYPLADDNQRPTDIYAEQMMFRQRSIVMTGLSWLVANIIPFVSMTKWFPVILMLVSAWLAFHLLFRLTDSGLTAFLFTGLLVSFGWTGWTPFFRCGLTPSDYLMLFYLSFLFGMVTRRSWLIVLTLFASLDIYAPAFIHLCLLSAVMLVWGYYRKSFRNTFLAVVVLALVASCSIFLFKYVLTSQLGSHSLVAYEQMLLMPEFYEGGRTPMFFPGDWCRRLSNPRSGLAIGSNWLSLLLATALLSILVGRSLLKKIPLEIWVFLSGTLLIFIASNMFLFHLFSPSRYVRFSIPLVMICIGAIALSKVFRQNKRRIAAGLIIVLAATVFTVTKMQPYQEALDEPSLAHYLATLPTDVVIAATPELSDTLNVFANRNGYISAELTLPYFPHFYLPNKKRVQQFFEGYYGKDLTGLASLCEVGDITHLVMNEADFQVPEDPDKPLFYQPFEEMLQELRKDRRGQWLPPEKFAAYRLPPETALFQSGNYRVYSCMEIINASNSFH